MSGAWQVGVDIGGTFTDVVAWCSDDGGLRSAKVRTIPDRPVASVDAALAAVGLGWDEVADLMHGTTLATNAIVEGKLAPVVLIATEGFRDVLAIARQNRRELYRLDLPPKLPPLVPDELRLEVAERIGADGEVLTPLSEDAAADAVAAAAQTGVPAVAVALINAYANPAHEEALGEGLRNAFDHVALSHRMNPEAREFERTSATVLNAALMPATAGYLESLLGRTGRRTRLHLFHSAGGMASAPAVMERPLALALSGPAAGVAAAGQVARELGIGRAISFDMGGTTTDVCLIVDGAAQISRERLLAGRPMRQPMVAVETIGAGGGSLAHAGNGGIRVGPESAGAEPGPACYGLGGEAPTVTDANLLLGYLDAGRLLGGSLRLDPGLARAALARLGGAFGVDAVEAALGVHRIANASMARALRRVTVERGVDARDCALIAFGGAGPMHAVSLAREFGIGRVVVPRFSSGFSALGCLAAELSYAQSRTVRMASTAWDAGRLGTIRDELVARLAAPLIDAGHAVGDLTVEDVAAVRYAGQSDEVEVPYDADAGRLGKSFRSRHEALYGFSTDEPWELESLRVKVAAPAGDGVDSGAGVTARSTNAPIGVAPCRFDGGGALDTPRYPRDALAAGHRIAGPAVIEDEWSTIVINPGATASADARGHILIDVGAAA